MDAAQDRAAENAGVTSKEAVAGARSEFAPGSMPVAAPKPEACAVASTPVVPAADPGGLKARVLSSIPLIAVTALVVWLGGWWFTALVALVVYFAVGEFCNFVEKKQVRADRRLGLLSALALVVAANCVSYENVSRLLLLSVLVVFIAFVVARKNRISAVLDSSSTILLILYCGWLPAHFVVLRGMTHPSFPNYGLALITLLVAVCVASDVGAYAFGKLFGKHKLCPAISPGKTREGSLGGLFLAVVLGCYVGHLFALPLDRVLALSFLGSVVAQCGDLFESFLKRDAGVKDSGRLIRGHGGALDRCDSYLLTVPFFYLFVCWFVF